MDKKINLSNLQVILMVLFCMVPTAIFFTPGAATILIMKQSSWITVAFAAVVSTLVLYYPIADLGTLYPGKTIIEYSQEIMGKWLGKVFALFFIFYSFIEHCWTLREFGEITVTILPATPIVAFLIALSLITAYGVYLGIEVLGRSGELVFLLGLISLAVIAFASAKRMEFVNILPLIDFRIFPFLKATIFSLSWFFTGYPFCVFAAFVNKPKDLKKISIISGGMIGIILVFISIVNILVQGTSTLGISTFPLIGLAKLSELPAFANVEIFVIALWTAWIFFRVSLFSFVTVFSIAQLFHLSDFRFLILSETVLAIAYSLFMYESFVEMSYFFGSAYLYYLLFPGSLFFLWIIARVRRLF